MRKIWTCAVGLLLVLAWTTAPWAQGNKDAAKAAKRLTKLKKIDHIIVIYQENWSFDSLYGLFPGADGLQNAFDTIPQVDTLGNPINVLPQPKNGAPDPRFPANLPVLPYDMTDYVSAEETTGDIIHRFYHEQLQIDGGKMDKFVAWSDNGGLVFSYIDATDLPEGQLAQQYVLCDNFFHSAFGGSFLNHQYLIAAAAPAWPSAPAADLSAPAPDPLTGTLATLKDNQVTPDGFAVNTLFTINKPHPASIVNTALLVPNLTNPTIGDRLDGKSVSWKWYSGGWDDALAGNADSLFQFHHQPFAFYASYANGTAAKAAHLQDENRFFDDLETGSLPAVTFIKPLGPDNEHPGYASLQRGQEHVAGIVRAVQESQYWKNSVIIVTYDENGGRWDHVAPPVIDRWGPGTRVPAIIISPFARRGFVDHTQYETVSILKLIEERFGLEPLSSRDANANDLLNALVD
jgi:acid phosphatase